MDPKKKILRFWFGRVSDRTVLSQKSPYVRKWFGGNARLDRQIHRLFRHDLKKAAAGKYNGWAQTPRGTLALLILLDQFSRHIHRGTAGAYAADSYAQRICLRGLRRGTDRKLNLVERSFFYLPLMHAESRRLQNLSMKYYFAVLAEAARFYPKNVPYYRMVLDYAQKHRDLVVRFGRYPHRNRELERRSTARERRYLRREPNPF